MVAFSEPENGVNESLGIQLENSTTTGGTLGPVYIPSNSSSDNPSVGLWLYQFQLFSRPHRADFRKHPNYPRLTRRAIEDAIQFSTTSGRGVSLSRTFLDNHTTTYFDFTPTSSEGSITIQRGVNTTLQFKEGTH